MSADFIRNLHTLFLPACRAQKPGGWEPAADLYRMPRGWLIKLDLAGVSLADVQVNIMGRCVVVRGVRRDCSRVAGDCYRMEIAYSRFERVMELPEIAKPVALATEYSDGMLLVRIEMEA